MGLQGGFTKHYCFFMLLGWQSSNLKKKEWPSRMFVQCGTSNVKYIPFVDPEKIILPILPIRLGLIKDFVMSLDKESGDYKHLRRLLQQLSEAKGRKYFR
ncbi:hypothetical protein AVEN_99554-1 [Araneus ventricosus]|uniref:Uncharacterized protein n=1 Tax=Araneus ventricosus TaxID=182803 RepID=A0A4Y2MB25_ARAVE|nr:hypothetical protein AVEN_99554-1 [Araneus ventricosus]